MSIVAVASTDGVHIDGHFNKIQEFYIYEVDEKGEYQFLEQKKIEACILQSPDEYALAVIEQLPADLDAVLAKQMDYYAKQVLYDKGIVALTVNLLVEQAVPIYGRKSRFLKRDGKILRFCGTCSGSNCSSCQ